MRKRYSRSYTVLSFLTMFSYRELPFASLFFAYSASPVTMPYMVTSSSSVTFSVMPSV